MTGWGEHVSSAFTLGFALGAAPGPVQVLILSETARGGFSGGLRVMLGANGTLFAVMVALALGFSSLTPGPGLLRVLRLVGGAFIVFLAWGSMMFGLLAQRNRGRRPSTCDREDG